MFRHLLTITVLGAKNRLHVNWCKFAQPDIEMNAERWRYQI